MHKPALTALALAALCFSPAGALAGDAGPRVSELRLRADVAALVGFGTRHTLSATDDPKRGIGAARTWAAARFREIGAGCGGCLAIEMPEKMVTGTRLPAAGVRLVDVIAVQKGSERPDEVVIVQGHIDSRNSEAMDAVHDAPGANDDGSGSALVLEAARLLSKQRFPVTIVYALLSGEEQGLFGGQLLAETAKARGWRVKAVLNNDIVGNSRASDGTVDAGHVRLFSEGVRADADDALRAEVRRQGGENDSPSRNLARWIGGLASPGLAVRQVWRADRMGRGGDHLPFQIAGVPAVRFTVAVENYDRQHQDPRHEGAREFGDTMAAMDFAYLARVTQLNVRAAAALARAPAPPAATITAAVSYDTKVSWKPVAGAAGYHVWRRRTDAPGWEPTPFARTRETQLVLPGLRGDDWFLGVSAYAADGAESPVASALPGGGFLP